MTDNQPQHETITINLKAFAEVVHQVIANPGVVSSTERASLLASWDTLVDLDPEFQEHDPSVLLDKIHAQVDAILVGDATIILKEV